MDSIILIGIADKEALIIGLAAVILCAAIRTAYEEKDGYRE